MFRLDIRLGFAFMVQYIQNVFLHAWQEISGISCNSRHSLKYFTSIEGPNNTVVAKIKASNTANMEFHHWPRIWSCLSSSHPQNTRHIHLKLNWLSQWANRLLFEKLTGPQLIKKFPSFYGKRRLVSAFTSARQLYLSWARSIPSIPPFNFLKFHFNFHIRAVHLDIIKVIFIHQLMH